MEEGIALGGIFLGCFMRALIPFLRKRQKEAESGKKVQWESRYIWTIILALAVSMVTAILILPTFTIPVNSLFPVAFTFGWTAQSVTNMMAK